MSEPPEGGPSQTPLLDAFGNAIDARADRRPPADVGQAVERYQWSTRELAQRLGVSERTARRYRQQNRIPARREASWRDVTRQAARERQRARLARRGLSRMNVQGTYRISRSRYRARRDFPVRFVTGKITGRQLRDVFELDEAGRRDEAEQLLNQALGEAYGAPGLEFEEVEGIDFSS